MFWNEYKKYKLFSDFWARVCQDDESYTFIAKKQNISDISLFETNRFKV